MSIIALTQKLNERGSDVDAILQQLQTLKKSDFANESQHREIVVSQCVQFCDHGIQHGRYAHVAKLFNFIHVGNSDDKWLPTVFNRLCPNLLHYYDRILTSIEQDQTAHANSEPPGLFRLRNCDINSLRLMSAIFELCVDFCDVMYAGDKLSAFVKPLYTLLCLPDFHEASVAVTAHGYALNELLRSASLAISNFLLTFTSLAPSANQITRHQAECLFETLSFAPELSIQRSLTLTIRSLYEASDQGHVAGNASASALSIAALKEIIESKLSTPQFGSGKALTSFRALELDDDEFLKNYESVIKLFFFRKRKALKCFSTDSCLVQVQETLSKRKRVIEEAYVEWNMNSVCVRDRVGNPIRNWPLFTVLSWEWLNAGKEVDFTFDRFHQFPEARVVLRFKRTLKRNDRKIIEERIENIQSMVPKKPTRRISRRDPMHQPGHRAPVAVSIALEEDEESADPAPLSEEPDMPTESEESSAGNRVETILSGFQDDGVFIRKRTRPRASSEEESGEGSSNPEGGEDDRSCALIEPCAESRVYDLFRDSDQHEVNEGHGKTHSSKLSASVKSVDDSCSSRALASNKIPTKRQSLPSRPQVLKRALPLLNSGGEGEVGPREQKTGQSQYAGDRDSKSEVTSKTDDLFSMLSGHDLPGNGKKHVGEPNAVSLKSRGNRATSSELRRLRPSSLTTSQVLPRATDVVDETYDCGQNASLEESDDSRCMSNYSAEISKAQHSVLQEKGRQKEKHSQICEDSMEVDIIDGADDENQGPCFDSLMVERPPEAVPIIAKEATDPVHMSEMLSADEAVNNENERMRQLLLNAVTRMLKCQVDRAHKMFMTTEKDVKLLQKEKRETSQQHLKAYELKVKKFADERKERLQDYTNQHGALISKARGLARELKVKLVYGQKQLKIRKQRAQRIVGRIGKQLETARRKMDDEFAELLASNKKREERNTKSSLAQNLMSMLGGTNL